MKNIMIKLSLSFFILLLTLYIIFLLTPRNIRNTSYSIIDAKKNGTFVARIDQIGYEKRRVVGPESRVELSWRIHEPFPFWSRRILLGGYTTLIDFYEPMKDDAFSIIVIKDIEDIIYTGGCCALKSKGVPVEGWLILGSNNRSDTVGLKILTPLPDSTGN